MRSYLLLATLTCCTIAAWSCEADQLHNGCKIYGNSCVCTYGCRSEYIYNTRRACNNALRAATAPPPERVHNICSSMPCSRGYCLQIANEPGFACKCEGTGFYGRRCEEACPTEANPDMVFPHECVII